LLDKFLTEILKVNSKSAQKDVHKMEHDLSEETIKKVIEFTQSFGKSA